MIVRLEKADDVKKFGGKAANLAKMLQAEVSVPGGFAISTEAYNKFHTGMSDKFKNELLKAFDELGVERVAVRSSAVAEDSSNASWAGQLETVLNVKRDDLIKAIEYCWDSMQSDRAQLYAREHDVNKSEQAVAVVVQAMVDSEISGVMFTANPMTGDRNEIVIEAIYGLGELLVQGVETPESFIINSANGEVIEHGPHNQKNMLVYKDGKNQEVLVDKSGSILTSEQRSQLIGQAKAIEQYYGRPQDIEFAFNGDEFFIVQSRPITTLNQDEESYLGSPDELFYWGPSRAKPLYMSDFMTAVEKFFVELNKNDSMPNPPKTLVLFCKGKMVWLSGANEFAQFTEDLFKAFVKRDKLDTDVRAWEKAVDSKQMLEAWGHTLFAEFSLYGAENVISKMLDRFDIQTRQEIWGTFTIPDNSTFLSRIDDELLKSKNPKEIASKYPWIQDGYDGVSDDAQTYFTERLKVLEKNDKQAQKTVNRGELATTHQLSSNEVQTLNLARKLAEFMDERKAWMMQTRHLITKPFGGVEHGWFYNDGAVYSLDQSEADQLWERYVDFKASTSVLSGLVASNGGKHFINGKVALISSPTDSLPNESVMVVPSTSPSYVPLMRGARAVITDHGGMMSHAAIVARELGLPCVVGTKQATKLLKNGDKVVIDLVTGEISR